MGGERATDVSPRAVRGQEEEEFAFMPYMECTPLMDVVDRALGYVPLRWSTADGADHSFQWKRYRGHLQGL